MIFFIIPPLMLFSWLFAFISGSSVAITCYCAIGVVAFTIYLAFGTFILYNIHEVSWNAPKSMWKRILSCDRIFPIFSRYPIFPIWFLKWEKWGISTNSNIKNWAFQKISTWSILKLKMNRNWNFSILGHFKLSKCYHMTKSSFTCFLGHFMIPRVV